jgi:hypothetical protein
VGQREGAFGNLLLTLQTLFKFVSADPSAKNPVLYLQILVSSPSLKLQILLSVSLVF